MARRLTWLAVVQCEINEDFHHDLVCDDEGRKTLRVGGF
jgi:hypothetical protein